MSGAKRKGQCSKEGCKAKATKAGKCTGHYLADNRAGVQVREFAADLGLGPDPVRLGGFLVRKADSERLNRLAPKGKQSEVLRRGLAAELQRMEEEAKP